MASSRQSRTFKEVIERAGDLAGEQLGSKSAVGARGLQER